MPAYACLFLIASVSVSVSTPLCECVFSPRVHVYARPYVHDFVVLFMYTAATLRSESPVPVHADAGGTWEQDTF